jgi:hypothetical protein
MQGGVNHGSFFYRTCTVLPVSGTGLSLTYFHRRCTLTGKLITRLTLFFLSLDLIFVIPYNHAIFLKTHFYHFFFQRLEFLMGSKHRLWQKVQTDFKWSWLLWVEIFRVHTNSQDQGGLLEFFICSWLSSSDEKVATADLKVFLKYDIYQHFLPHSLRVTLGCWYLVRPS